MKTRTIIGMIFIIAGIAALTGYIILGTYTHLIASVICLAFGAAEIIRRKAPLRKGAAAPRVILLLFCAVLSFGVYSAYGKTGIYDLKLRYAGGSGYTVSHFPDLTDDLTLTDMGYTPSVGQGSGWVYAGIECGGSRLDALESAAAEKAVMRFTLGEYQTGTVPADAFPAAKQASGEGQELWLPLSHRMESAGEDVLVYLIYSNFNPNHIRTDAVLIDRAGGYAEYVGM